MKNQLFGRKTHDCMWIKSWLLNEINSKPNWSMYESNNFNQLNHEHMKPHEPSVPNYMDATRLIIPMNYNG